MTTDAVIRCEKLCKSYRTAAGEVPVLRDVDLQVDAGESLAIMGPSGSGKSTLMNILGCLDVPSGGRYLLNGNDVRELDRNRRATLRNELIGFVFQGFNLLPRATLADNVALPLVYGRVAAAARSLRAHELLEQVGLQGYERYFPNQISGGQQQRVAIARALANRPRLVLADEPTGNLDTHTSRDIMELFVQLNASQGITLVLVTHEPDIAAYTRRLVQIVDGRIVSDTPVERDAATPGSGVAA